jgi:hypothetical protein
MPRHLPLPQSPAPRWRTYRFRLLAAGLLALALPPLLLPTATAQVATRPAPASPGASSAATTPATQSAAEVRRQEEIARVMEFFRVTQPDVYEQAKILRTADAKKFDSLISGAAMTVNKLESLKRKNPKLFDLSMRDFQLHYESMRKARELKRADLAEGDRRQLKAQLGAIVAEQYDVRQQIRQTELEDLRQKLKDLDAQLHDRQKDKDNIIKNRIDDLIERAPGPMW